MSALRSNASTTDHRVLVDMSMAAAGYTGIPHETRLLLNAFWKTDGLQPTGLLFDEGAGVLCHRFHRGDDPGKRLENHAVFLFQIAQQRAVLTGPTPVRRTWWRGWRKLRRMLFGRRIQTQYLDNSVHGESAWRLFLEKSLDHDGLELGRRCPFLLANLGRSALKLRASLHLPTFRLNTDDYDFLVLHEAMPLRVNAATCKLIRLYDLIPGMRPELVDSRRQIVAHMRGIRRCQRDSVFVCASEPTRADLVRAFPEVEERAVVIPVMLGNQLFEEKAPRRLGQIIRCRRARTVSIEWPDIDADMPPYLLTVCSIEPRKNHLALIQAYHQLRARRDTDLVLVFVGSAGWRNAQVLEAMTPLMEQGKLIYLERVPTDELRILYSHARAVVFPSLYEGFGYAPLEGMQCGAPAIASDIPVHRWVYGDAALYFDPFRADDLSRAIERLLFVEPALLRPKLIENGFNRIRRYLTETVGRQWHTLCEEIRRQGGGEKVESLRLSKLNLADDPRLEGSIRLAA